MWEVSRACPAVSVGVHELAVVLPLPDRVPDTVKWLCGRGKWHIPLTKEISENFSISRRDRDTSEAVPHEDLVSQRVAQNYANKLPVPRPFDVLAALTAAVGWVILEFKGNPDGFSTCEMEHRGVWWCCSSSACISITTFPIKHLSYNTSDIGGGRIQKDWVQSSPFYIQCFDTKCNEVTVQWFHFRKPKLKHHLV